MNSMELKKLKTLATINYGKSPKEILSEDGLYPVVGTGGIERYGNGYIYDGESIILGRKGTIDKVTYIDSKFWTIDTAYYLSKFRNTNVKWLYYFLSSLTLKDLNEATGVPSLSRERLYDIDILYTSKPEQTKIAEILSTVDKAIEQTEAIIAKQRRIKNGLMQDLLTKGIDENGNIRSEKTHKFKDSPLGRIPVEWEVVQIKDIAKIVTGSKDTQDSNQFGDYPFFVRSQKVERINSFSLDCEAVLTAGDGVGTGKVFHYINGKFDFHQRVYCIHSFRNDFDGFFFFQIFRNNFLQRVSQFSAKGTVDSVRLAMISEMNIVKPNNYEQKRITKIFLNQEKMIELMKLNLSKLQKLKTALMQDLLTGKVRVTKLLEKENILYY